MSWRSSPVRRHLLLDACTERDLIELQQLYRRAERSKPAYTEKTRGLIQRHKREIQRLQDEHEGLLRNLRVSHSCFNRCTDVSDVRDPTVMLACEGRVVEELEAEKDKVASLNNQISEWERKLLGQRTGWGTTHCSTKSENGKLLKIKTKLHRGIECFNKLMSRNGESREELKTLQMEKKKFLHVQSQLEKELHAIRKDIGNLMTNCTEAFANSVGMKEEQRMLREQNAKDVAQCSEQRRNLKRELSYYGYLKAFIDTKANAHNSHDVDHRRVEKCKQLGSKELELNEFENVMTHIILKETEDIDLDKPMKEQNYTLLNFVNYQRNEVEAIRRQIPQLCCERETWVAEEQKQQEQHRALQLTVAIKQEATEQQLAVYQQRVQFMEKLLDQVKEGVKSLLQVSYDGCDQLGSSDSIQDENIEESLKMVEDRVKELLTLLSYVHFQAKLSKWDSLSTIAEQLLGSTAPAVSLNTAAATPAPKCAGIRFDDQRLLIEHN
ncbi:outer dynein arm-docking complex subunit 1-like [Pagrus major]|uniref:outer dynein arm-docking complex subunit 1-like n=1 Tax=Pagrus major TaxID=143350 RepID=UPI003CC88A7E